MTNFPREELILDGSALTATRVAGIVVGAVVVNVALRVVFSRFFGRIERGDAERIASLQQVARTLQRVLVTIIAGLLVLDTLGLNIGALVAALGVIGLAISFGAQPLIRDIIGYVSYVFADNFRVGEDVSMDGKRGKLLKFELRGVVLKVQDETDTRLAYIPYSRIGTIENFDRAHDDV